MDFFCTTQQFLELDAHDDFEAKSKILKKMQVQQRQSQSKKKWRQGLGTIDVRSIIMER